MATDVTQQSRKVAAERGELQSRPGGMGVRESDRAARQPVSAVPQTLREALARAGSPLLAAIAATAALVLWAYYPTFDRLVRIWWSDPQYSHGFLVPAFAAALCWLRRDRVQWTRTRPSWWAVPVLFGAAALRLFGTYFYMEWFEHLSLLPLVLGLLLAFGGWPLLRGWWPAVLFLIFMIPFPYRFEIMLSNPLQRIATKASCYLLQTLGEPAVAEGNTILLYDTRLEVVQACNGLRMAVSFVALAVAVVMVVRRPLWERALILASALPIALISNVLRITVTGVLSSHINAELAHVFFHDVAGWLMMPLALGLLWGELALVNWVLTEPPQAGPIKVGGGARAVEPQSLAPRPRREAEPSLSDGSNAPGPSTKKRRQRDGGSGKKRRRRRP